MTNHVAIICCLLILFLIPGHSTMAQQPEGLKVGTRAPLFIAEDQFGEKVQLKELLEQGSVVLLFYRGHWCKYCNRQLEDLSDSLSFIVDKGASVITVTPEVMEFVDETSKQYDGAFRIISDVNMRIMKDYRVAFELKKSTVTRYKLAGIKLEEFNGDNGTNLPVPAAYVIDRDGKITYVFFNENYRKRVNISTLLEHL